ncbi:MAG: hypothetical protein QOE29_1654, partial [Gaiellaceae bacterium]|nr:hypothetical protein [Gaiellaceae bacterium]
MTVCIPAFEEEENLRDLLPRMPSDVLGQTLSVVVVDDGSADSTAAVAAAAGAEVVRLPANAGGGAALRAGYRHALLSGAEIVVTMDADGQHRPEDLPVLLAPVLEGRADFVQGSRVIGSSEPGPFARELGISVFNRLISLLLRRRVSDCSNSYRAMCADVLRAADLRQAQFHAPELLIEAVTRGFRYTEVPVTVLRRGHGTTKKPRTLTYGLGFAWSIVRTWARSLRRRG